ncbi:GNAT family N-acetyltransferase [Niveispirillum irakense]|uniref:GNAT family N-acetyltransferase n=1 Tax=Niveispirillum irakense TaxID=34011 RepID=UPI0004202395|nr:GNAT family N-acetyltransferase [Niveispirillum irakense]
MTGQDRRIVAASPVHVPVMAALHASAFADPAISGPAWDADNLAALMAMPGVYARILLAGEVPVGLALWRVAADEAELLTLGVDAAARGKGHGRELLRDGIELLHYLKMDKIFLEVAVSNNSAICLYLSAGFTSVGRRPGYYRHGGVAVDADIMMRPLHE